MKDDTSESFLKAKCSRCGGQRNCDVLGQHDVSGGDEHFDWHTQWYLLRCRGCEHVFAQTVSTNSEDLYYDEGPDGQFTECVETIRTWPPQPRRPRPHWFDSSGMNLALLTRLWPLMQEVYAALDAELNVLAAMGMRIVFDKASDILGVDPELTFKEKLDELVEKDDRVRLEALVDAGGASAHRGWRPSSEDLNTMMDVLENFVHDAFVAPLRKKRLDARLAEMKASVPPRPKRVRGKPQVMVAVELDAAGEKGRHIT